MTNLRTVKIGASGSRSWYILRDKFLVGIGSLLCPGSGQLYNAQYYKALLVFLFRCSLVLSRGYVFGSIVGYAIYLAVSLLGSIVVVVDAVKNVGHPSASHLGRRPRWYVFCGVYIIWILIAGWETGFEMRTIASYSMEPSLVPRDTLMVDGNYDPQRDLRRGDIVTYVRPGESSSSSQEYICRVIGLPGETVQVRGYQVLIDGEILQESNVRWIRGGIKDFGPAQIPEGAVFLLGDNRDKSGDSRFWSDPFLPLSNIKGRARYIVWSTRGSWERLGKPL